MDLKPRHNDLWEVRTLGIDRALWRILRKVEVVSTPQLRWRCNAELMEIEGDDALWRGDLVPGSRCNISIAKSDIGRSWFLLESGGYPVSDLICGGCDDARAMPNDYLCGKCRELQAT